MNSLVTARWSNYMPLDENLYRVDDHEISTSLEGPHDSVGLITEALDDSYHGIFALRMISLPSIN